MKESFKVFRKRPLSNDPAIKAFLPHFSCARSSTIHGSVKDSLVRKDKEELDTEEQIDYSSARPSVKSEDELGMVPHPSEPVELDRPIRCPPPEPSIIQDARKCGQRLGNRRGGQLPFLTDNEVQSLHLRRRNRSSESLVFPSASTHEAAVTESLE